jgi:Fe-S cluster biosynthesis and repair protein YggX
MENKGGRMLFDGKDEKVIIQKLEEVFLMGGTDQEACLYADISKSAFYEWQKKNEWFLERKEALKANPVLKARKTIVESLSNPLYAKWYLERRMKKEFSTRIEYSEKNKDDDNEPSEELIKKVNDSISNILKTNKLKQLSILTD